MITFLFGIIARHSTPDEIRELLKEFQAKNDEWKDMIDTADNPSTKEKLMQLWIQRNNDLNKVYDLLEKKVD